MVDDLVRQADGVFLWAVVAIKNVRDGLQGLVDLDELEKAINTLPPELDDLFMLMLKRIKSAYQRDAARFMQITLEMGSLEPIEYCDSPSSNLNLHELHFIRS